MHERVSRKKFDSVDKQAGKVPDTQRPARKVYANIKDKVSKLQGNAETKRIKKTLDTC